MKKAFLKNFKSMPPGQKISLGFAFLIAVGMILLALPISSEDGQSIGLLDALFTSTSGVCVTGLTVINTGAQLSFFGQVVLIVLIQLGGLGFMLSTFAVYTVVKKKITLSQRMTLMDSLSEINLSEIVDIAKNAVKITAILELCGALIFCFRFVPMFGWGEGIFVSVFQSVSAFCNAGFDLMGQREAFSNLSDYAQDPLVNLVIIALIVMGGLGFLVWRDLHANRKWNRLSVHTRLVLIMTALLLLGGTLVIFILEYSNPQTLGNMPVGHRVLASLFQATTCRTAGFNTIDQGALRSGTAVVCILLMFVGGSSGSTAGGIKTTSVAVLILAAWSVLRSRRDITVFHRRIEERLVLQAVALVMAALSLILMGSFILYTADNVSVCR